MTGVSLFKILLIRPSHLPFARFSRITLWGQEKGEGQERR